MSLLKPAELVNYEDSPELIIVLYENCFRTPSLDNMVRLRAVSALSGWDEAGALPPALHLRQMGVAGAEEVVEQLMESLNNN